MIIQKLYLVPLLTLLSTCGNADAGLEVNSDNCKAGVFSTIEDGQARDNFIEECRQFIIKKRFGTN